MFLMIFTVFFAVLIFFLLIAVIKSTYLVRQAEVVVIERLGCFYKLLGPGIHFVIPFLDQKRGLLWPFVKEGPQGRMLYRYNEMLYRIDLRETVYDFPKQNVITKDNVTIEISALLYFQITDPKAVVYEVANLPQALEKLAQTTMRDIIGAIDLDQTLTSRNTINEKLRFVLDVAADKWGVKVNRVELQEINPPADIKEAMEMQMRAERDRRALILEAEGQKSSAILKAEGDYQSKVIRAKGEAESRLIVSQAEASAIKMIQDAVPDQNPLSYMVAQNYIKMLPEITSDKNGKLILLPYESSALMGSLGTIKELFNQKDK